MPSRSRQFRIDDILEAIWGIYCKNSGVVATSPITSAGGGKDEIQSHFGTIR